MRFWLALLVCLFGVVGPAFAGGDGGHGFALKVHGFYLVNFIIFMAIVVGAARKPIGAMLRKRSDDFEVRFDEARRQFEETQESLNEARLRIEQLEMETMAMMQRLQKEGDRLKSSINERAEQEEDKVRKAAEAALANEKSRLEKEFQSDLALAAVSKADEKLLQSWRQLPQDNLVKDFISQVEALNAGGGGS
jgi:F0F1-type ATP synthase membrane subunit b/b'